MFRRPAILALLFMIASCTIKDPHFGSGPITLSPQVKASFEEYKARDAPIYFVVTESGFGSFYVYCEGGFNCTGSAARMHALDQCRRHNPGEECKVYAMGRNVVWQDADAPRAMPGSQLSASDRLIRECLDGDTPRIRVDKCSQAIASPELAHAKKRNPYDVRAPAYEQIGNMPGAEQDYRAVLSIDPDHPAAKARLEQLHSPAAPPAPAPPKRG